MAIATGPVAAKLSARRRLPAPAMRKAIRVQAQATQADLASLLHVQPETICRWESGTRTPSGRHLVRYVELLDELQEIGAS